MGSEHDREWSPILRDETLPESYMDYIKRMHPLERLSYVNQIFDKLIPLYYPDVPRPEISHLIRAYLIALDSDIARIFLDTIEGKPYAR